MTAFEIYAYIIMPLVGHAIGGWAHWLTRQDRARPSGMITKIVECAMPLAALLLGSFAYAATWSTLGASIMTMVATICRNEPVSNLNFLRFPKRIT